MTNPQTNEQKPIEFSPEVQAVFRRMWLDVIRWYMEKQKSEQGKEDQPPPSPAT